MEDIEKAKERVGEIGGRIRRLLGADLNAYVLAAMRERFVASPEFADTLGDAQVAALKRAAAHDADEAAALMRDLLSDDVFLAAGVPDDGGADIRAVKAVDDALTRAEGRVARLFEMHGLPGEAPPYALPVRFIDGDDLVSLTRGLWKALGALARHRAAHAETVEASNSESRRRRWDEA